MSCKDCLHGAVGLAKAALRIRRAPADVVRQRRDCCRKCWHATRSNDPRFIEHKGLTTLSRCNRCACFIAAKTANADEACPLGLWPPTANREPGTVNRPSLLSPIPATAVSPPPTQLLQPKEKRQP